MTLSGMQSNRVPKQGLENVFRFICTENRPLLARDEGFLVWKMTFGGVQSNRVFARDVPELLRDEDLREYFEKFGVSQSRNLRDYVSVYLRARTVVSLLRRARA